MSDTIKGIPTRDFQDSGTEKRFNAGQEYEFTPGEHANYLAAGLITAPTTNAADPKVTDTKPGKNAG